MNENNDQIISSIYIVIVMHLPCQYQFVKEMKMLTFIVSLQKFA